MFVLIRTAYETGNSSITPPMAFNTFRASRRSSFGVSEETRWISIGVGEAPGYLQFAFRMVGVASPRRFEKSVDSALRQVSVMMKLLRARRDARLL
jgi:hypothetical protein